MTSLSLELEDNPRAGAYVCGLLDASRLTLKTVVFKLFCYGVLSSVPYPLLAFPSLEYFSLLVGYPQKYWQDPPTLILHLLPFVTDLPFLPSYMVEAKLLLLCTRLQRLTVTFFDQPTGYRARTVQKFDLLDSILSTGLPRLESLHINLPVDVYVEATPWDKNASPPFSAMANHVLRQTASGRGVEFEIRGMVHDRLIEAGEEEWP